MKLILTLKFVLICSVVFAQADTTRFIKVHFLYGSKPKHKYRSKEVRYFGGIHGGHVTIQVDDVDYGFEPATNRVHIFPHKKFKSDFVNKELNKQAPYGNDRKTATFVIPVTEKQYSEITRIHRSYCDTTPFDYAFFGMRCASASREILGRIGIMKRKKHSTCIRTNFYPKRLRKKLFRLAEKNHYAVIKTEGKNTRKWERD